MNNVLRIALVLFVLGCVGCSASAGQQPIAVVSTPVAAPQAEPTVPPTAIVAALPLPSATPTSTVLPTATITPEPTSTPAPTSTPEPTAIVLRYVFPVEAASVDYGASHHDYPATDIFCAEGSKFVAPTSGVVDFVSREDIWNANANVAADRGGLSVAIIGDDGWRYYGSHLLSIAEGIEPGVRVDAGQVLGLTGKSGNARSTPPHLHFGISHPTTPDDWQTRRGEISPFAYLKAWQRGELATPGDL